MVSADRKYLKKYFKCFGVCEYILGGIIFFSVCEKENLRTSVSVFTYGSVLMSRTSSNGCTDRGDLASRLPATNVVYSVRGSLPITIRHELHIKPEKNPKVWITDRRGSFVSQGHAASSLMALIFKICVFGCVPGLTVLSQKSWRLYAGV